MPSFSDDLKKKNTRELFSIVVPSERMLIVKGAILFILTLMLTLAVESHNLS